MLDLAVKQINEHTDITVKYDQHKRGRNITGFTFTFKYKLQVEKTTKQLERDLSKADMFISTQTHSLVAQCIVRNL